VCGNGGVKPRHADLLARDLDDRTLIKFIDRFLMFYIRTGDRLQRTSTWLENLEGGIAYVRKVVCEDSLGIGAELEADMQKLVGGHQVAVFRLDDDRVYAIDNHDPFSRANVLSRGIVGDLKGELVVASPVYKQHFSLTSGLCLEDPGVRVPVYPVRLDGPTVLVKGAS